MEHPATTTVYRTSQRINHDSCLRSLPQIGKIGVGNYRFPVGQFEAEVAGIQVVATQHIADVREFVGEFIRRRIADRDGLVENLSDSTPDREVLQDHMRLGRANAVIQHDDEGEGITGVELCLRVHDDQTTTSVAIIRAECHVKSMVGRDRRGTDGWCRGWHRSPGRGGFHPRQSARLAMNVGQG